MRTKRPSLSFLAIAALCAPLLQASPVKIFILAGQSNMQGKGQISPATTPGTLDYTVANDTAGQYSFLKAGGANYVVRNDVWIKANGTTGGLTVGYGAASTQIGPELGFGHRIGGLNEDRVLIVKVAAGGKSLGNDFLPPSSGPYATPVNNGDTGYWYAEILRQVNDAITNLATYVPGYVPSDGYVIAGFGWHQGWNDRISAPFSAAYETNMANFIRDMRSDLAVPGLPFVIATTAMDPETTYTQVELAQLAVAAYPEFAGNVATIDCRSTYDGMVFWQRAGRSPRDEGYHWNFNANTYLNIGLSMGDAMSLIAPGRCPFRLKASGAPGGGVSLAWKNGAETPNSVRILRDGSEIAAAVPGATTTFLDSAVLPGSHTYQLEFTMPVTACPPLNTTFNGGVTGLALSRTTGNFVLSWKNNMAYTGIEVRRDGTLLGSPLSGTATTFTDPSPPATGNVTYTVTPTTGSPTPASVTTNLDLRGQLNVLNVATANGGINPTTGNPWQAGEQYRLIFATKSTSSAASTDIATYNTFVQNAANAAGLGTATWKVLGSTQTVAARDNTGTNNGLAVGVPVILMDGTTVFADNNNDLWGGANSNGSGGAVTPIYHEDGTLMAANSRVWTGTNSNGTIASQFLGNAGNVGFGSPINSGATQWILVYGANNATSYPLYALSDPLTIQAGPDTTPPTVVSIADNKSGGPILASVMVTYTVTFSEPMNASTVDVTDFENGGAPAATIQSVSPTGDPAVFLVNVIPGGAGTLKLQVAAAAVLRDQSNLALVTNPVVADDNIITVNGDSVPPTLVSFQDDKSGGSILTSDTVTYTVTFSEPMNASTVDVADFENGGSPAATIQSVSPTGTPAVFTVLANPGGVGTLRLQIKAGTVLADLAGNPLATGSPVPDDTTLTVNAVPTLTCQVGILNLNANGGINPATGAAWQAGATYRLIFVTSTTTYASSTNIDDYNTFVQSAADAAGIGSTKSATWKALGSTATVDARDNTGTNPSSTGVPVFLMDGATVMAVSNADLWNGANASGAGGFITPKITQNKVTLTSAQVWTGSNSNGTKATQFLGAPDTTKTALGDPFNTANISRWLIVQGTAGSTNLKPMYAISQVLTVQASGTVTNNYLSWAAANGVTGGANGDSNNNGIKNLVEYALVDGGGRGVTSGNTITFTKRGAPYGGDVSYGIETSTNLVDWSTPGSGVTQDSTTISYTLTPSIPGKNFTRLKVVKTP